MEPKLDITCDRPEKRKGIKGMCPPELQMECHGKVISPCDVCSEKGKTKDK